MYILYFTFRVNYGSLLCLIFLMIHITILSSDLKRGHRRVGTRTPYLSTVDFEPRWDVLTRQVELDVLTRRAEMGHSYAPSRDMTFMLLPDMFFFFSFFFNENTIFIFFET